MFFCNILIQFVLLTLIYVNLANAKLFEPILPKSENTTEARSSRSGLDPNYGVWGYNGNGLATHRDLISIVPVLLMVGLGILILPFITSFFSQAFTPIGYPHGRKRRSTNFDNQNEINEIIQQILVTLEKAIDKYKS